MAWDYLQYVIGLARLGHEVYYHEDTLSWPYYPAAKTHIADATFSANYLRDFFARYAPELRERWRYPPARDQFRDGAGQIRLSVPDRGHLSQCQRSIDVSRAARAGCAKIFLDTDPGYSQIMLSERFSWSENVERWCASVTAHDQHFTYAENIHGADCIIPKGGFGGKLRVYRSCSNCGTKSRSPGRRRERLGRV